MKRSQQRVLNWAFGMFGPIAKNRDERVARVLEEACELAQAEALPLHVCAKILARVYSRPVGLPAQELGGLGVTMEAYAEAAGIDAEACTDREWRRMLEISPEFFRAKEAEKIRDGVAEVRNVKPWQPPAPPTETNPA